MTLPNLAIHFYQAIPMMPSLRLDRFSGNPILSPTALPWENAAVCNPAALDFEGNVHLFYRAIDTEGISSIGHAVSADGLIDWQRFEQPILERQASDSYQTLGVEDPRITWLEETAYLTYTLASVYPSRAPKPWDAGTAWRVRVGMSTSEDLEAFTLPKIVIPRRDSKNAVLFPEKVAGRYVMFHRQYPDVWIATSEDGLHWAGHKPVMRPRPNYWDSERVGSGPPPILTEHGWALLYHGTEIMEQGNRRIRRYRAGIALFERENPAQLIARSPAPLFEPEADYEAPFGISDWQIQVVFPTGWIVRGDRCLIYYGAGDTQIGVATVSYQDLLNYMGELKEFGTSRMGKRTPQ
jgi:predicted GH43/DUF377 family glycosyl hydrolase